MTTGKNERDLKLLFDELKAADVRHAPPFRVVDSSDSVWQQAHGSSRSLKYALATGFVVLLTLAIVAPGAFRTRENASPNEEQQWAAFSDWEAATDTLLAISSAQTDGTLPGSSANEVQVPSDASAKSL